MIRINNKTITRIKKFKLRAIHLVIIFIALVLGLYFLSFKDRTLSKLTADWGSFGNYFGGMLTLLSILLLYYTLQEQKKENHRNWFDSAFTRRLETINTYIDTNKPLLQKLSQDIISSCEHSLFDNMCDHEDAKVEISNLYIDVLNIGRNITEGLYYRFKKTFEYILGDNTLDNNIKEAYIHEFEQSLNEESVIIILSVMCNLNENITLRQLRDYRAFRYFQTKNPGFDILKDALFSY